MENQNRKRLTQKDLVQMQESTLQMEEYWWNFRPKMYAEMMKDGTLLPTLRKASEEQRDMHLRMLRKGLNESQILDFLREEIYSLPPEK